MLVWPSNGFRRHWSLSLSTFFLGCRPGLGHEFARKRAPQARISTNIGEDSDFGGFKQTLANPWSNPGLRSGQRPSNESVYSLTEAAADI